MRRTIMMENGYVIYLGKEINYLFTDIRNHFKLWNSKIYKYVVTIIESKTGKYRFKHDGTMYGIYEIGEKYHDEINYIDEVCKEHFVKIFFRPKIGKRYSITVKKVRIRRNSP